MSLKAICQVILLLQNFQSLELRSKGIYTIKVRLAQSYFSTSQTNQIFEQLRYASPYQNIETEGCNYEDCIIQDNWYKTRSFKISFRQQKVELKEAIMFKMELETYPDTNNKNIYIYLDLYFADERWNKKYEQLDYLKLTTLKIKLNNLQKGICDFSTLQFENKYKSSIDVYVFSILMDYKFRIYKLNDDPIRAKIQGTLQFYKLFYQKNGGTCSDFYFSYIKRLKVYSQQTIKRLLKCVDRFKQTSFMLPQYTLGINNANNDSIPVTKQQFMYYLNNYEWPSFNLQQFQAQMQMICIKNYQALQTFIGNFARINKEELKNKYSAQFRERCGEFIFRSKVSKDQLSLQKLSGKQKLMISNQIRSKQFYQQLQLHNIQDPIYFPGIKDQTLIFCDIEELKQCKSTQCPKNVLFVFAHGFQGCSFDMLVIMNSIKKFHPTAYCLISKYNNGLTDGSIQDMGNRLAQEIHHFIKNNEISSDLVIHMVGHSMGGIILRAALKNIEVYSKNMGTFLTLSSPHIGYLNGAKSTVEAGLWFIKKWNKVYSFEQLAMTDNVNYQNCFLFKLSETGSLKNFRNVVTMGSYQDSYVPWHSARIHSYYRESEKSKIQKQMIKNILYHENSSISKVYRIDFNFNIPQTNIDSLIGRTAHIKFLTDETLLRIVQTCITDMFQ